MRSGGRKDQPAYGVEEKPGRGDSGAAVAPGDQPQPIDDLVLRGQLVAQLDVALRGPGEQRPNWLGHGGVRPAEVGSAPSGQDGGSPPVKGVRSVGDQPRLSGAGLATDQDELEDSPLVSTQACSSRVRSDRRPTKTGCPGAPQWTGGVGIGHAVTRLRV